MDRLIIRMLPAEVRARHGEELAELLDGSSRPVRDRADVLLAALGLRLGVMTSPLLVVAVLGVGGFDLGLVHAVGQLARRCREILDHWWSTFILGGLASHAVCGRPLSHGATPSQGLALTDLITRTPTVRLRDRQQPSSTRLHADFPTTRDGPHPAVRGGPSAVTV